MLEKVKGKFNSITDALFNKSSLQTLGLSSNYNDSPVKGAKFARAEEVYAEINNPYFSTSVTSVVPSRYQFEVEKDFVAPESQKQIYDEITELCNDDPMLDTGLYILTHGAAGDGFGISFKATEEKETPNQRLGRQAILEAYKLMAPFLGEWCEHYYKYGNQYTEVVADEQDNLIKFKELDASSMERLSDQTDEFPNPKEAYRWTDAVTRSSEVILSSFQVVHGRYRRQKGSPYGRSGLFPARQSARDALKGFAELIKRRARSMPIATYIPLDGDGNPLVGEALKRFKYGEPGKPDTALPEIRAQLGDTDAVEGSYPHRVVNGGDFKMEAPDVKLGVVDDLTALVDRELATLSVPRGLITGDVVNFATLNALLKHLYAMQRILCRAFELAVIRPLFDRVLLLVGVLSEEVEYELDWGQRLTTEELQFNVKLALDARKQGDLDQLTFLEVFCQAVGRKDAKQIQKRIEEEKQSQIPQ